MDITLNKQYWVLTETFSSFVFGEFEYNALKLCTFKHCLEEDDNIQYCFYPDVNIEDYFAVTSYGLPYVVFEDTHDYLIYIFNFLIESNKKLNISNHTTDVNYYSFDNFIKIKIEESQKWYPEKWI